jgi:hypothetical protein
MPQNWWELFPEVLPSPAAATGSLPGPGPVMVGPTVAPQAGAPYGVFGPYQFSSGPFDPTYFSGGEPGGGQLQGRFPDQAAPLGYAQRRSASDQDRLQLDRKAAVQQAAAAIRGGADPTAVRARLNQVGRANTDFCSLDPFSDLMPGSRQVPATMNPSEVTQQEMLPAEPLFARGPLNGNGYSPVSRLSDPQMRQRAEEFAAQMRPMLDSLPADPAVHAMPLPNDHPFSNPGQNEGEDTIVVRGPRPANHQAQRQAGRNITLTDADVLNIKKTLQTEWVQRAGADQARGIIDTILNRLASGHFGSTISAVVNQRSQFSAINGQPHGTRTALQSSNIPALV